MSGYTTSKTYKNQSASVDTSLFFKKGGNLFGSDAKLGLKDDFNLDFITNDIVRGRLTNTGRWGFGNSNPQAKSHITGEGNTSATKSLVTTNSDGVNILEVFDDRRVNVLGSLWLGLPSGSRIELDNTSLQIAAQAAGFNTASITLGSVGSVSNLNTTAPAWTMNQALRFDGTGPNFIYCNNGGAGLGLNGGSYFGPDVWISNGGKVTIGQFTNIHSSAIFEIRASELGILIPRMPTAQRNAIATPANGLLLYNTTTNEFNYYNGTVWRSILSL